MMRRSLLGGYASIKLSLVSGRRITTSMMKPMIAKRMNGTSQAKSISAKGNIINHFKITPCNKLKLFSICKIEIINVITVASR